MDPGLTWNDEDACLYHLESTDIRDGQYVIWTRIKAAQRILNRFNESVLTDISGSNNVDVKIFHHVCPDCHENVI